MKGATSTGRRGHCGDIKEPTYCNGSTLAWNARDVGSVPALGTIFPIFITPAAELWISMTAVSFFYIPYWIGLLQ